MKLERIIYQKSHIYFLLFFVMMVAGFWLSYFTKIFDQENYRMHLHGISLILWCILLFVQAYLIRTKYYELHRRAGKLSYVIVPMIAFTTVDLYKYRLDELTSLTRRDYLFTASVLIALLTFLIYYALAMINKGRPTVHARYMICTIFPMFTAVIDRIISAYFPFFLSYFPDVDGPVVQVVGLTLGDLLLGLLCLWDWRSHRRINVFPVALALHLIYHYAVLNFYKFDFWHSFSNWVFEL
jgi:hypothetical protein